MLFEETYKSVSIHSEAIFKDKGSKFIGIVSPVKTEKEAKEKLTEIRKKYNDATHHCYAYRIGIDKSINRTNDDGEPAGTAGKPIHNQIQSFDLTNTLIVVVRYYGGTKLGVSGLINAYKTVSKEAIENNKIIIKTIKEIYELKFDYEIMNTVMKVLKEERIEQISFNYQDSCSILIAVNKNEEENKLSTLKIINKLSIAYLRSE